MPLDHTSSQLPKFSIVTVVKNDWIGLASTSRLILSQTHPLLEWIIIDGASTDGTTEYIQKISDPRVFFTSEPDSGIYDAMNKGLALATGDYCLFLNARDTLTSARALSDISLLINCLNTRPDMFFLTCHLIFADGRRKLRRGRDRSSIFRGIPANHQAILFKVSFCRHFHYDTSYRICGDYDYVARLLMRGATTFVIDYPISSFEVGGASFSHPMTGIKETFRVQRKVLRLNMLLLAVGQARRTISVIGIHVFQRVARALKDRRGRTESAS